MAHALPMRLRGAAIGSVNILQDHDTPVAESPEVALAQTMADVATIGILQQRALQRAAVLAEQLEGALNTRIIIEQAKGVLIARLDTSVDDVFGRMRAYSRRVQPASGRRGLRRGHRRDRCRCSAFPPLAPER